MVGTQKPMKNFKKILVSSEPNKGPKFKKIGPTIFSRKILVFLIYAFICSYLTAVACTIGNNTLN